MKHHLRYVVCVHRYHTLDKEQEQMGEKSRYPLARGPIPVHLFLSQCKSYGPSHQSKSVSQSYQRASPTQHSHPQYEVIQKRQTSQCMIQPLPRQSLIYAIADQKSYCVHRSVRRLRKRRPWEIGDPAKSNNAAHHQ